jgi:glycosyltransferase involved in cell wall biosynthesis
MRILFLSPWHPYPPDNGARLRIFHILKGLSEAHEITLMTFAEKDRLHSRSELERMCRKVIILPKKDYDSRSRKAILGYLISKPRVLVDRYVPEMAQLIDNELSRGEYDLVIASNIYMADYIERSSGVPAIFEEAEVGVFTDAVSKSGSLMKRTRSQLTLSKLQSYFQDRLPHFEYCTVVSNEEKELLGNLVPNYKNIQVIPNGVSLTSYEPVHQNPEEGKLLFTGSLTFEPNLQAMKWFAREVLPLVKQSRPDVQLIITGDHGGNNTFGDTSISFSGYVDDIRPLIASAWISIAPIFSGGGTRLKILEAFGLKTPVIATSKGAEGLEVQHGKHILIADTPGAFARETIRLLNDAKLRAEIALNAYQLTREKYDWSVIIPDFLSLIGKVA